jgi:RNase P subunit RPR2
MAKVVGIDPGSIHRVTCRGCASILEYTESEVQTRHGKDYSGGADGDESIRCPNCGKKVIISSW